MNTTDSYRAEFTIRSRISDVMRAILLRYLPESKRAFYRIRLIPAPRKSDNPPLVPVWFRIERRVALVFWREIGACRHGDMHGAKIAISADVIRRRIKRLRPTVVASADAAGKVMR
ncbi:hypothetical protein DIE19_31670 [Burkholderia sp. Bp9126]|nr:hypothetical protein DIE19_31670 [Burkholderia sp. Bp9126]